MKMLFLVVALVMAAGLSSAATICPTTTHTNTDCGFIITIASNGNITGALVGSANPYDGCDDSLVGVVNNETTTFTGSIALTGSGIFGFDGDGICTFVSASYCATAATGYEGPINTFTVTDANNGTVNITGLAGGGGTTFFSLEDPPDALNITNVGNGTPEPATLGLIGAGLAGLYFIRRRRTA